MNLVRFGNATEKHQVLLDFDGGTMVYRNRDLGINIPAVVAPSGMSACRRAAVIARLNREYARYGIRFIADAGVKHASAVHIGQTSAFDCFGHFSGLAEGIGSGDAYVMLDDSATEAELVSVIRHEAGHLLGTLDHGGLGLVRYAYRYTEYSRYGPHLGSVTTRNVSFSALTPPDGEDELYLGYNEGYTYINYSYNHGEGPTEYYTDSWTITGYVEAANIFAGIVTIKGGKATQVTADRMTIEGCVIHDTVNTRSTDGDSAEFFNYQFHQGGAYGCVVRDMEVTWNAVAKSCTVNTLSVSGADTGENSSGNHATAENCTVTGLLQVLNGGEAKNAIVRYDATASIQNAAATNLITERGSVFLYDDAELNNAKVADCISVRGENVKVSGLVTCDSVLITDNFSGTITVKLDLRDYAVAGYTERIEDSNGYLIEEIQYFSNYTTRTTTYNYIYDPFGNEQYSTNVSYGSFDNLDGRFDIDTWGDYRFSVDIGMIYNKAAMSHITLDFGGTEKLFDSGELYVLLPECYEGGTGDGVIVSYQPAVNYYTTIPFNTTSDRNKWRVDEDYTNYRTDWIDTSKFSTNTRFIYNPTLHGETADVLWLDSGWYEDTEYSVELPPEAMSGTMKEVTISDKDGGSSAPIGGVAVKNSKLVIKGGASTGNFTVKAEDSGNREHECDLELIVVPETIPVVGKIGAKRYSEMLKKAQKSRLTKISEFWPYDIETKLFGLKFCLSGLGVSLTVNWTEPTMELKFQGKLDWEIGKGESKNLTLDLSGDNYFAVTHKKGSLGWDLVGELQVPDFKIGKFGFSDMILKVNKEKAAFTVGGYVQLPGINYKFGGSIGIVDGCLDSMSIGVDNLNVPLGSTGLMLQSVSGSVQGIATSLDMTFGGNLGLTFGPKINVQWKFDWLGIDDGEYSLLEISAGVTISTSGEIGGSASLSTLGGFITGGGEIQASEGNFTIKGNFTMLNGCISLTGEFNSDAENGVVITGRGRMAVPRNKFFGPLAGMGLTVNVKADYKERYVMAWENTEIFGNKFSVGVKSSFDGEVELVGASDLLGGDSDLAPEDGSGGGLRVLPGSASDGDGLRGAETPSASRIFLVSGGGLNIFQVNFSVSASIASMSLVYNGDEYTQAAISAGLYENMQIVNELTSSTCLTVAVNNTGSGEWTVNAYGDEKASFGAYSLAGSAAKPAVNAVEVGADGRSASIRYTTGDLSKLENAMVSVFRAAGDAVEHNGALIGKFSAADATGNFFYAPADDLPGGSYAFYLMVESGNYAPEYSDLSAACDFITIDTEAPDQIQKVRAEWHSAGSVLSWNVPYDNIGVAGYKVNYRASETDGWTEANVAEAAFTFEGVANAAYTFRVAAYDAAGNVGAWSSEDSVLVNLAANAVYHDVTLAEDTALAEFEGAVNVNSENVRLTAAGNTLISNSSIGEAEIGGIIEDTAVAGEAELLAGARGFSLAVTGGLTVGNRIGNETEPDPFAEPGTEAEYIDRAVVADVTVGSEGTLTVGNYGQVNNVTVVSGGAVFLTDDAEALGLVMDYGTALTITGQGKYYLVDDIRTAGTLNTRRTISANGSKIIFEQYKQTAEYQNDGTGNTMDNVAFTDIMDKLGSNVLEIEIDSSVYGFFKIADQAPYFDGTITVTDHAAGNSAAVGFDEFTLVGNALCRLEKFPDGLFLSTSRSTLIAPTVTVEQAESSACDTVYVKAVPADGSGFIKQVSFRYSLNADMSDAVVMAADYIDYNGEGSLSISKYDLVDNAVYYVQAVIENEDGIKSLWSDAVSFSVVPKLLPDAPAALTVTGATDPQSTSIIFSTDRIDGSDPSVREYRFRYADNPEFENAVIIATGQPYINSASISKSVITDGKDYYVQAGVKYGSDWSYWSDTVVFNTQGWDYENITVDADGPYAGLTLGSQRARNVRVVAGGYFYGGDGQVDGITIDGGFFRDDGARVSNAVVSNGGSYWLSGSVSGIQVNSGELRLFDGSLDGATIGVDGVMDLGSSGQTAITGTILIQGNMEVYCYHPGVSTSASFVFDLGAHEAARDRMFIDCTGPLLGTRTFTVQLDDTPEIGEYALTSTPQSGELYIRLAAADGSYLGIMSLGGAATAHEGLYYSLIDNGGLTCLLVSDSDTPAVSEVTARTQVWNLPSNTGRYIVEYSTDSFEHAVRILVDNSALDSFAAPGGCQWRVRPEDSESAWSGPDTVSGFPCGDGPMFIKSNADGIDDVFFARADGKWNPGYAARHVGSINDWSGTLERIKLNNRNKLSDIFEGSADANVLLMTDDANGDALFVDDIYTALPGTVTEQQARIARIDEIRAGAGDDIVDMTSQRFEYTGDGLTVRGGAGDDIIWANKGGNMLFGDDGHDRLVGASGNDVLAGGRGNDNMHGGGGIDIFTFGANWGIDKVEQLASGDVVLWFESGSFGGWNADTLTYSDGSNSVRVSGVTADKVTLKFGDDGSSQYVSLKAAGTFDDFTSENIFEDKAKGLLA